MKNSIVLSIFFIGSLLGSQSNEDISSLMLLATTALNQLPTPQTSYLPSSNPSSPAPQEETTLPSPTLSVSLPSSLELTLPADQSPEAAQPLSEAQQKRRRTIKNNKAAALAASSLLLVDGRRNRKPRDLGPVVSTEEALKRCFSRKTFQSRQEQIIPATPDSEKETINDFEFSSFATLEAAISSNSSSEPLTSPQSQSTKVSSKSTTSNLTQYSSSDIIQGYKTEQGFKFECPYCNFNPGSARFIEKHLKNQHSQQQIRTTCPICDDNIALSCFYKHLGRHHS